MALEGIENLNLKVNITVFAPAHQNQVGIPSRMFRGHICSREKDQSLTIQIEDQHSTGFLSVGITVFIFLAHDMGLYIYSTKVRRRVESNNNLQLVCNYPQQIKYFQRRNSVRVNTSVPVTFSADYNRKGFTEGTITDISIGGMKLEAPLSLPIDTVVELVYQLDDIGPVFMDGKVVRVTGENEVYVHGLEFVNSDQFTIDAISKFIMAEQMRQKNLGLHIFKVFVFNAAISVQTPAVFSIVKYLTLDVSAIRDKTCNGMITEISTNGLVLECPLKLPLGSVLEFVFEMPKIGYFIIQAEVKEVTMRQGKFQLTVEFALESEKLRDLILERLAKEFSVPFAD